MAALLLQTRCRGCSSRLQLPLQQQGSGRAVARHNRQPAAACVSAFTAYGQRRYLLLLLLPPPRPSFGNCLSLGPGRQNLLPQPQSLWAGTKRLHQTDQARPGPALAHCNDCGNGCPTSKQFAKAHGLGITGASSLRSLAAAGAANGSCAAFAAQVAGCLPAACRCHVYHCGQFHRTTKRGSGLAEALQQQCGIEAPTAVRKGKAQQQAAAAGAAAGGGGGERLPPGGPSRSPRRDGWYSTVNSSTTQACSKPSGARVDGAHRALSAARLVTLLPRPKGLFFFSMALSGAERPHRPLERTNSGGPSCLVQGRVTWASETGIYAIWKRNQQRAKRNLPEWRRRRRVANSGVSRVSTLLTLS